MPEQRDLLFAANWKMHHGPVAAREAARRFLELSSPRPGRSLWFFPPAASIEALAGAMREREDVSVGAQHVHWEAKGAFTGELSVGIAAEAGARGVLIGHSERRHLFGETDDQTRRKVRAALDGGLRPFLCVGEKLEERQGGATEAVVLRQLEGALGGLSPAEIGRVVIAYEPVWAIGTGLSATPSDAAAVHAVIRRDLETRGAPARPTILYGGSVSLGNVLALLSEPEIDGVLVGGASLDPEVWAELTGW